jgi:phosphoserine phosphatase RsbU/P
MAQPASLLLFAAALLSAVLAAGAGLAQQRSTAIVRFMFLANVGILMWASAYFVQIDWSTYADPALAPIGSPDYFLLLVLVGGIGLASTYWFLFCAATSERGRWWTTSPGIWVAHVPALYLLVVAATNPLHHLFVRATPSGAYAGPLALPHYATMIMLVLGGIALVAPSRRNPLASVGDRRQRLAVAWAACLPLAGIAIWMARRIAGLDVPFNPTPALFAIVGCVIGYQVLYRGLGNIVPLAMLSSIVQNTGADLAYLAPDFSFDSVNDSFCRRSLRSRDELLGRGYFEVMPDDGRRQLFEQSFAERRPVERSADPDFFPKAGDAPASYWNWSLTPVVEAGGGLRGFVLSAVDVTESVHERELSRTLTELDMCLHEDFASDAMLWTVVTRAGAALGGDVTLATLSRERGWRIRESRSSGDQQRYDRETQPHIAFAIENATTVVIGDAQNDDRVESSVMKALGLHSALVVPLVSPRGVVGALSFERRGVRGTFSSAEVDFADRFASAVMLALENSRLYQDERRIAQTLQESMLRISFRVPGVDFAHIYRSATEAARVGGDFYDLFQTDDGRIGLLIGDVSGHGIEAAVLTSLIKNTVRSEVLEHDSPARIMSKASEVLLRQSEPEVFASAFLGLLDPADGTLTYCNAGHPPCMLLGRDGRVSELSLHSLVLGVVSCASFMDVKTRLEPGQLLVMYTDGITEARRGEDFFGFERLGDTLGGLGGQNAEDVVRGLFETVRGYADDLFSDDIAVVALRLLPGAAAGAEHPEACATAG